MVEDKSIIFVLIEPWISIVDFKIPAEISRTGVNFVASDIKILVELRLHLLHERKIIRRIKGVLNFKNALTTMISFEYTTETGRGIRKSFTVFF